MSHTTYLRMELYTMYIQVLAAYVKSIEDHGYVLHFGLPSFMGFLPKNNQAGKHQSTFVNSCCFFGLAQSNQALFLAFFPFFGLNSCRWLG